MMGSKVACAVMAGGRGERMGDPLKFAVEVCGRPLLARLADQLRRVCRHVVLVVTDRTREVSRIIEADHTLSYIELPGRDYVEDLGLVLRALPKPMLIAPADLVIKDDALGDFVARALGASASVVSAEAVDGDRRTLLGLTLFHEEGGPWLNLPIEGGAIDVDTPDDLERARSLC